MKKLLLSLSTVAALSGCTTMFQGYEQTLNIDAQAGNLNTADTLCRIKNEEGQWYTSGKLSTVTIERDGNPMFIECTNSEQVGYATVDPSFQTGWLLADIVWDACIITLSCFIDAGYNSFYEYPDYIKVEMKEGESNGEIDKAYAPIQRTKNYKKSVRGVR